MQEDTSWGESMRARPKDFIRKTDLVLQIMLPGQETHSEGIVMLGEVACVAFWCK